MRVSIEGATGKIWSSVLEGLLASTEVKFVS
jgi:hypothetical protein